MGTLNSTNLTVNDCQDWVDRGVMEDHPELPSAIRCAWDYLDMIYQLIHPNISGWHCFPGDQVWTKHLLLTIIKLLSGLNQLCKLFFGFRLVRDWWFRHDFSILKKIDLAFDLAPEVTIPVEHLFWNFADATKQPSRSGHRPAYFWSVKASRLWNTRSSTLALSYRLQVAL